MKRLIQFVLVASVLFAAFPASGQITITPNVPQYGFQVIAGSTRQINVQVANGAASPCGPATTPSCVGTVNWSITSTTGGASATFTDTTHTAVSSITGGLATIQVNIGTTAGSCSITGTPSVTSTATVTVTAQSTDTGTPSTTILFNVCANSTATLANGTSPVIVAPAYQQVYQTQPATLQSWIVGQIDETGTWSIESQPTSGDGHLADTGNRDTALTASVPGRYTLAYTSHANGALVNTGIVYVSPNPMPSYAVTPQGTRPHECYPDPLMTGPVYTVGPGKTYSTINSAPAISTWVPGTMMMIYPGTYPEYYQVSQSGTATQPIIICGVPDSSGNLPIMDGTNATGNSGISPYAAGFALLNIEHPGSYSPWQDGVAIEYVSFTGIHLRHSQPAFNFQQPGGVAAQCNFSGSPQTTCAWYSGTASIRAVGAYIDLSGNAVEDTQNGFFTDDNESNFWGTYAQNITITGNDFKTTGAGSGGFAHSLYIQGLYHLIEGNLFDTPVASPNNGNAVKIRGGEFIARYNNIVPGYGQNFDVVDNTDGQAYVQYENYINSSFWPTDTAGANVLAWYQESSQKTFIYGNLAQPTTGNEFHYNADVGAGMADQNGTLYMFSNTTQSDGPIIGINDNSTDNSYFRQRVVAQNNIIWPSTGSITYWSRNQDSIITSVTNLFDTGTISITPPIVPASLTAWNPGCSSGACPWPLTSPMQTHLYGLTSPNYLMTGTQPFDSTTFIPPSGSAAIGAGTALSGILATMPVRWQWNVATGTLTPRTSPLTIGAEDPASGPGTVATPTFSPVAGSYGPAQTVTISTATGGASLVYTNDGSTPTVTALTCTITHGTLYSGPLTVSTSQTLNAIGCLSGDNASAVGSAAYVINGTAATPTFSPVAGSYGTAQSVTISTATGGAALCYTTDGSTPLAATPGTCSHGTTYSTPVTVSASLTLKAIATEAAYVNSGVGSAAYVINGAASTPTFSPSAGAVANPTTVTASTATSACSAYLYLGTTNPPTANTSTYSVTTAVTLYSYVHNCPGWSDSSVSSAVYTITSTTPITTVWGPITIINPTIP